MKRRGSILIVDDDEDVLATARMILRQHYENIETSITPESIEKLLSKKDFDLVILDMNFKTGATSGNEGLFWLRKIKEHDAAIPVIMNTAYGDISLAVNCMKEGATDFLVKPWEREKFLTTVNNVFELSRQRKEINRLQDTASAIQKDLSDATGQLIGSSKAMQEIRLLINKVAPTDADVLILGENGTGKEVVARAIHNQSQRNSKAFIKVDLGAMSPTLFESELFGHVKGAFTDAREERSGRFELAHNGTLFLDEIANIPLNLQSKLLSVLQNRQINKVGSGKTIDIDIRLISATNKPVYQMAANEDFRQDLLYRINTVEILLPPLRERVDDIPLLLKHFLNVYCKKYEKNVPEIRKEEIKKLQEYDWPGNIRELQHAVERAVIMHDDGKFSAADFIPSKGIVKPVSRYEVLNVGDLEKEAIINALSKAEGNLTKAAVLLGLGRSTLYRKMNKYGL